MKSVSENGRKYADLAEAFVALGKSLSLRYLHIKKFMPLILSVALFLCQSALLCRAANADDSGRFGTVAHPFTSREVSIREPLFDSMKDAGVQWLRFDFPWWAIEKKGVFDFKIFDEILSQLRKRNIKVLGILGGEASFGNAYDNTDEWIKYVEATVSHFKGRVSHWEIINEHNIGEFGKRKDAAEKYGAALKRAYAAIKAADPDAVVLYGGLGGVREDYVEKSLKVCGTGSFDIMNFHSYPAPFAISKDFKDSAETLRKAMRANGGEKPIWITETGLPTPDTVSGGDRIIRPAIAMLNLKSPKIYAIKGWMVESVKNAKHLFPEADKIEAISYAEIAVLGKDALLVLPVGQSFPGKYADALVQFVKNGGTLIYQGGGIPLFYESSNDNRGMGSKLLDRMHVNIIPDWDMGMKMPAMIETKNCAPASGIAGINLKGANITFRTLTYTGANIKGNDKFIPLVYAKVEGKDLVVAAIYKLDSDFKGNVIFVSACEGNCVTEDAQAAFIAQDFIFTFADGIDKLFIYNFRSHGTVSPAEGSFGIIRKDMSRKPAFYAYKTLAKLLGDTAKPVLSYSESDGIYCAEWKSPKGQNVYAFWSTADAKEISVSIDGSYKALNVEGNVIKEGASDTASLKLTPAPLYIVGGELKDVKFSK